MNVYLDNCVFNRPFDDQTQSRIRKESEAISSIHKAVVAGDLHLVWSYINEYEASRNPFDDIRSAVFNWCQLAKFVVPPSLALLKIAYELRDIGIKPIDSLHIAASIEGNSHFFVTTDDGILSKIESFRSVLITDPVNLLSILAK